MKINYIISCKNLKEAKRLMEKTDELLVDHCKTVRIDRKNLILSNEKISIRFVSLRQGNPSIWEGFRGSVVNQSMFEEMLNRHEQESKR